MGLFLIGATGEDSATKLKTGQLNVCTVCRMCTVYGVLFSPLLLKFTLHYKEFIAERNYPITIHTTTFIFYIFYTIKSAATPP